MEIEARSQSMYQEEEPAEADIDLAWFYGLRKAVLSCYTQSRMEMELTKRVQDANPVPWSITSALTILSSDADNQRKSLIEYFISSNGTRVLFELLEYMTAYKVGERAAKILRELVSQRSGKQRTAIIKQCLDANYLAVSVSVLRQLVKGNSNTSKNSSKSATSSTTPSVSTSKITTESVEDSSASGVDSTCACESKCTETTSTSYTTIATICSCCSDLGNGAATTADFIWFLAGVVAKDSHFPEKVRQMLKVKFFHDVFKKLFFAKSNLHFPLFKIMRQLSKTRHVANVLGKDRVMHTMKKAFTVINQQPNQKMLILMETLALLTRDRRNAVRFLKAGLLVKVLGCFRHWAHWKGKGLLKLSKSVINIFTHLARTKSGKPALKNSDALSLIRTFCEQCPQERSFDDVIMRSCAMIHVCFEKDLLPLQNLECPVKFQVPNSTDGFSESPLVLVDSGSSSDEDDPEDGDDENEEDTSDSENEDEGNSDNDDLCDDDDIEGGLPRPRKVPSRKNSSENSSTLAQEINENTILDKMARFSFFFRELSPFYLKEIGNEPDSLVAKMEKLDKAMSNCTLEDSQENGDALKSLDFNDNVNLVSLKDLASLPNLSASAYPSATHKYSWTSRHGTKLPRMENLRKLYFQFANKIHHVAPFVKIAYPDICFALSGKQVESLCANADRVNIRKKVFGCIARAMCEHPGFRPRIVYSLDDLIENEPFGSSAEPSSSSSATTTSAKANKSKPMLGNSDENEVGRYDPKSPLTFESRFECGNLRKAIQVGEYEYDLLLNSDINSSRHNQWFYFQLGNVADQTLYTFNIVNCIKTNSLFNYGMQPVIFSVMDAIKQKPGWVRSGTGVCYFRNGYKCIGKKSVKTYHTLSFSLTFHNKGDIVYVAYYIPYTYTRLMVELHNLLTTVKHSDSVHCRYDVLCKSLDGNDIPLLTITAPPPPQDQTNEDEENNNNIRIQDREVLFITSRVHPGETNASWVMMGILRKLLLGTQVDDLLKRFVFKVVPMLNVEGVVNGCHRSGLTSQDLNRCWKNPSETLHPSIYCTKMMVAYCCKIRGKQPLLFLDLHGHSRRKNAFFYGCSNARSWRPEDRITPENPQKLYALAESMAVHCPYFVMHFCHYDVRKSRESTARVAVWREFGIPCSFTLECSYCGCDRGQFKGITFGTGQLWEIGEGLCEAIQTMDMKMQLLTQQQKLNIYEEPVAVIESFKGT